MNGKISKLLSQLFSSKGLTHEEEQIVEEYRCSSEEESAAWKKRPIATLLPKKIRRAIPSTRKRLRSWWMMS